MAAEPSDTKLMNAPSVQQRTPLVVEMIKLLTALYCHIRDDHGLPLTGDRTKDELIVMHNGLACAYPGWGQRQPGLDGPSCPSCGGLTQRTGACYTCTTCGTAGGCG